jgi:lipopolysaccharide transport system permease protein
MAGLFPWQWLSNSLTSAPNAFIANAPLVKKIAFPRHLIVMSSVATEGLHFLLCLPLLALLAVLSSRGTVSAAWIWGAPLLVLIQGVATYGIALGIASLNVFFRDLERLLGLAMTVLFFVTPVIYEPRMVPPALQPLIAFNPFTHIIVAWRELLLNGTMQWRSAGIAALIAAAAAVVGQLVYQRLQWKFAEAL